MQFLDNTSNAGAHINSMSGDGNQQDMQIKKMEVIGVM